MRLKIDITAEAAVFWANDARVDLNSIRAEALVLYLCLSQDQSSSRAALATLLWQDSDQNRALGSLRQLLRRIKKQAPSVLDMIVSDRDKMYINQQDVLIDVDEMVQSIRASSLTKPAKELGINIDNMLARYSGIGTSYDSWLAILRTQVEAQLREPLLDIVNDTGRAEQVRAGAARSLLVIDPTYEPACRFLMRHYATSGNTGAALRVYETLYRHLDEDFDVEPMDQTAQLVADIKLGYLETTQENAATDLNAQAAIAPVPPELPVIYVPEFDAGTSSGVGSQIQRVFHLEFLASLSKFREWRLFDVQPVDGNFYRLDGVVSEHDSDIIFIATLRRNEDGCILWSERFQIGYNEWPKTQWIMAQRLSIAVNTGVSNDRLNRVQQDWLPSQTVFDKWVAAQTLIFNWQPQEIENAGKLLVEILDAAPKFSPAHASKAVIDYLFHINTPGQPRQEARLDRSLSSALRALELDPLDSRAHLSSAWAYGMQNRFEQALFHFDQCFELTPNSIPARMSCALGYAFADRKEQSVQLVEKTLELVSDLPPFLWGYAQNVWYLAGDLERAAAAGNRTGDKISNLPAWHAAGLWEQGHKSEAKQVAQAFAQKIGATWSGNGDANDAAIVDWFVKCFPLSDTAQHDRLAGSLSAALRA